jgi:hypothetical protein
MPSRSQDPVDSIWVVTKPNLERTARQNLEMSLTQTQTAEWTQVTKLQRSLGQNSGGGEGRKEQVLTIRIAWGYAEGLSTSGVVPHTAHRFLA